MRFPSHVRHAPSSRTPPISNVWRRRAAPSAGGARRPKVPWQFAPPAEYSALREEYLHTPHCVWPETALSYLQAAGARFYRLPDGCAAVSEGPLRIVELLGPPEHAAALCHCLGASGAEVSAPGMETPHGMVKSLRFGQKTPPAYLGFAFD